MAKKISIEQLDLFSEDRPLDEKAILWEKYTDLKRSHDKLRRRLFSELDELRRQLTAIEAQNERIICIKETADMQDEKLGWIAF